MKTDSSSKTQLIVKTKYYFRCQLRETYVKTKKRFFMKTQCMS